MFGCAWFSLDRTAFTDLNFIYMYDLQIFDPHIFISAMDPFEEVEQMSPALGLDPERFEELPGHLKYSIRGA